jgi:antitoxin component YwqK of YwqJK toxin-antitoxin module
LGDFNSGNLQRLKNILTTILLLITFLSAKAQDSTALGIVFRTFYDDEQTMLNEQYYLKDSTSGIVIGSFKEYYQSGKIAADITYENGIPSGPSKYYFENGNLKMRGNLENGKNVGTWEYYFENGKMSMTGKLSIGIRSGEWKFYFENGQLKSRGVFKEGFKEGIWNYFTEDGVLKAQATYTQDKGRYQEFFNSGALKMEGMNEQGKSEGKWTFYYETGEVEAIGNYEKGLKNGLWKYYHENEKLSGLGYYNNGEKEGRWVYYFEDGQVSSEGDLVRGEKEGFWKLYYESGVTKGEGSYNSGSGLYKEYYENGRLKLEGDIINENYEGTWLFFTEDGTKEGEANYENGVGNYKGYYRDGSIKMEGQLNNVKRIGEWRLYNPDSTLAGTYNPIYEEEDPIFFTKENLAAKPKKIDYDKPAYKYKSKNSRYFSSKINEFRGYILSVNPFSIYFQQLITGAEIYFQERLGYELQTTLRRSPFFLAHSNLPTNNLYMSGGTIKLKQKFYQRDTDIGMFYFGHEIGFSLDQHRSFVTDSVFQLPKKLQINENRMQYGVFIGNRWMKDVGNTGIAFDLFLGLGVGKRQFSQNFTDTPEYNIIFNDVSREKVFFPLLLGVQIGYAGTIRKSKN